MSTPTPDYGEPWRIECGKHSIADTGDFDGYVQIHTREARYRVAEIWNPDDEHEALFARIIACVNALAGVPDPAAEIARLRKALNSFDAIDKERNDALKICMTLLENMYANRNQHKVAAYTDEIEAAMAQIKTCYDPHA